MTTLAAVPTISDLIPVKNQYVKQTLANILEGQVDNRTNMQLGVAARVPNITFGSPYPQGMSDDEYQSITDSLLSRSMGLLEYTAETLDKAGATARGMIHGATSGDAGEVVSSTANLIPFSDSAGLTDPSQRVTGRQQLEEWGLAPKNYAGLGGSASGDFSLEDALWDTAGFGYEVLTDPLTYTGIGALGHGARLLDDAGLLAKPLIKRAAKAAGKQSGSFTAPLHATVDDVLRFGGPDMARQADKAVRRGGFRDINDFLSKHGQEQIGYLANVGGLKVGKGSIGRAMGSGLDATLGRLAKGRPYGVLQSTFDPDVKGIVNPDMAESAKYITSRTRDIRVDEANRMYDRFRELSEAGATKFDDTETAHQLEDALRAYVEHGDNYKQIIKEQTGQDLPIIGTKAEKVLDQMISEKNAIHRQAKVVGIRPKDFEGLESDHFHRGVIKPDPTTEVYAPDSQIAQLKDPITKARQEPIHDIPGQTTTVNKYARDPRFSSPERTIRDNQEAASTLYREVWHKDPVEANAGAYVKGDDWKKIEPMPPETAEVDGLEWGWEFNDPKFAQGKRILTADADKLDELWSNDKGFYIPKGGGGDAIEGRYEAFEEFLEESNEPIGMADVRAVSTGDGHRVSFGNGRHRFAVLRDQGYKKIPVVVDEKQYNQLFDLIGHKDPDFEKAKGFAKWLRQRSPEYVKQNARIFGRHVAEDQSTYMTKMRSLVETGEEIHRKFGESALPAEMAEKGAAQGYVDLKRAYNSAGLSIADEEVEAFARAHLPKNLQAEDLDDILVPRHVVNDAVKLYGKLSNPEEIGVLKKLYDSATNLWKIGVTGRPAFHARNQYSGLIQNWLVGAFGAKQGFRNHIRVAKELMNGKETIKGLSKKYPIFKELGIKDDKTATRWLREQVDIHRLAEDKAVSNMADLPGGSARVTDLGLTGGAARVMKQQPGAHGQGLMSDFKEFFTQGSWNPLKSAGIWDHKTGMLRNVDEFKGARLHRALGTRVEGINRVSGFLGFMRQGIDPAEAARRITLAHVDYNHLTKVEREWLRRVFPFYNFNKGMSKFISGELIKNPGGKLAQTIRAGNTLGREGYLPDYVGEGLAIRLGEGEHPMTGEKSDVILSGLGLMHESPFGLGAYKGGHNIWQTLGQTGSRTAQKIIGSANPMLTVPIEAATQTDLFRGQNLSELDPPTARAITNVADTVAPKESGEPREPARMVGPFSFEHLMANSPFSSWISTVRKGFDPRKGTASKLLNTLTGVRITNVNQDRKKDIAARELMEEAMAASPRMREFRTYYQPEWIKGTPLDERMLEFHAEADKRVRESKQRTRKRIRRTKRERETQSIREQASKMVDELLEEARRGAR